MRSSSIWTLDIREVKGLKSVASRIVSSRSVVGGFFVGVGMAGWSVRCSWCGKRKDENGYPMGPVLPQGACDSDVICQLCAAKAVLELQIAERAKEYARG